MQQRALYPQQIDKKDFSYFQIKYLKSFKVGSLSKILLGLAVYKFQQQRNLVPIKMNKKLLTIQVLKQRICNMQQQLNKLEKQKQQKNTSKSLSKYQDRSTSPIRNTSSNKRYKSPTFWTGNPLLGQENPCFSQKTISPVKKHQRNRSFCYKSPIIQKIGKDINLSFYQTAPNQPKQKQNYESGRRRDRCQLLKRGCQIKAFEQFKNVPKVQKKKTYDLPRKNPILDPEPTKLSSKKLAMRPSLSPNNMYIDNPNSNPNLYFNSTQPITLSPKAHNNRNNSPDLKLLLSNSVQNINQFSRTPKSSKKHYGRYYEDNLASKWMVSW